MDVVKVHGHANQWHGLSIAVMGEQGQSHHIISMQRPGERPLGKLTRWPRASLQSKTSSATRVHFHRNPLGLLGLRSRSVINRTGLASRSIDPIDVFGMMRRRFCVNSGVVITSPSRLIIK